MKIIIKLGVDITPPIEKPEQQFCDRKKESLMSENSIAFYDASFKNEVMGSCKVIMTREK